MTRAAFAGVGIVLAAAGCAVGPDFRAPAQPAVSAYVAERLPAKTASTGGSGGAAQRFAVGRDLPGEWWTLFGSTTLDALIKEALANYPSIAAQQAALRAARDDVRAGQGVFLPKAQGTFGGQRAQVSGASIAPGFPGFITNVFQANVGVSYTFDIFGGGRRELERLEARVVQQNFLLEGSYLTLTANVASTAVQLASAREQIAVTRDIISLEQSQLGLIQRQYAAGIRTQADVLQQQSNLASVRASLPPLRQQRSAAAHELAVLTGHFPHNAAPVEIDLSSLKLPENVPVSLPSALVAQRPDIRAQEALMHEASAAVGVATANMLPQLTLSGSAGGESLLLSNLLTPGAGVWNLAAGLTQPLFAGGALNAKRRAAAAAFDQAAALYRLTVLNAFQNVADTLTALDNDAQALKAESDAVDAARASLDLIKRQYDAGAVNYVSLLAAQQIYQQSRIGYVRALASRYTDTITLFQALGGGWWNRNDAGTLRSRLRAHEATTTAPVVQEPATRRRSL